jgi:iron complex transport system substrate-binding protein
MTLPSARALAAAALLVGCARPGGAPAAPGTDAHRIVSVSPSMTEALFAIGDGDRVVGRSRYCDYPPEALGIPIVGGFVDVDIEAILELSPDLVAGTPSPAAARLDEQLSARHIPTYFPDVNSLEGVDDMLRGLGQRTRHVKEAARVTETLDAHVHAVERAVSGLPPPRVLVVLQSNPVVAAGPKSFMDELLTRARAVNVLTEGPPWQVVSLEHVVELDPDLVVDGSVAHTDGGSSISPSQPGWGGVRCVRDGRVVALTDERAVRPGPRIAEGLASVARAVHPNAAVPAW